MLLIVGSVALCPQALMGAGLGVGISGALAWLWFVATLGCAGLIAHELCTERVVHFLHVTERPQRLGERSEG